MFPLWGLAIGLLLGFLRRGKLNNLSQLPLRAVWLIFVGLIIQLLIFPTPWNDPLVPIYTEAFHLASYALIGVFFVVNWRIWALWIMGSGMVLNATAILINGGLMPASAEALRCAGALEAAEALLQTPFEHANTTLMRDGTQLNFLGDWLCVPAWVPLANAFSIGDMVLMIGLAWLIQQGMCRPASLVRSR